ncbi:MAG TPA: TIGR03086 family metal-binding protein [Streptosporangiaceae bacterium]|jgi:uncharacterized protein (TIGR03086 family)|nr:TIGR03086 family metal-binding protein [Streptosporangiaceae bacterium]
MHTDSAAELTQPGLTLPGLVLSGPALIELDATAVRVSVDLVAQLTPADLTRPTPCAGWTLYGLLAHMATQHYGFAAAAAGQERLGPWRLRRLGPDPAQDYRAAAETVLAAFAADGVLGREFTLPEFTPRQRFTAAQAISFHFIDYVVHSWDVARALGLPVSFGPALLAAARGVASEVPGGEARLRPGAAFAPAVPLPGPGEGRGDGGLDEIVALLGRSPAWPD